MLKTGILIKKIDKASFVKFIKQTFATFWMTSIIEKIKYFSFLYAWRFLRIDHCCINEIQGNSPNLMLMF